MTLPSRHLAARWGLEAVQIIRDGGYTTPSGHFVTLRADVDAAARNTREYPPECEVPLLTPRGSLPALSVENASVMVVGRRMAAVGPVAALNFASAVAPGGGFLSGARAQEVWRASCWRRRGGWTWPARRWMAVGCVTTTPNASLRFPP